MKWLMLLYVTGAFAQTGPVLTLEDYLNQVKSQNPQARSLMQTIESTKLRHDEPEQDLLTEFYANYRLLDNKQQQLEPVFMGSETKGDQYRLGLRKTTDFGLHGDLYFNTQHTQILGISNIAGIPAGFTPPTDYNQSAAVLEVTQSLWRNSFGEATRAEIEAKQAGLRGEEMQARYGLKIVLLNAQNAYWTLVSMQEIVKLQQENVERARKTRDRMSRGAKLRLFDDTDAMQAEAAFESRELELQTSLDQLASAARSFNTLRGEDSDEVPALSDLPTKEFALTGLEKGRMSREDYDLLRAQAEVEAATAKGAVAQIHPKLDLVGMISTTGLASTAGRAEDLLTTDKYPSWYVGAEFSIPIDIRMIFDVKHGYQAKERAARLAKSDADFNEQRAWKDIVKQHHEALGRYQRAVSLEKIQNELVKRERRRLANGRATTFEALNMEQNLALAQIQRVRSQLDFMQINNSAKTFEAAK
jgi:outer membrane protein TolC